MTSPISPANAPANQTTAKAPPLTNRIALRRLAIAEWRRHERIFLCKMVVPRSDQVPGTPAHARAAHFAPYANAPAPNSMSANLALRHQSHKPLRVWPVARAVGQFVSKKARCTCRRQFAW